MGRGPYLSSRNEKGCVEEKEKGVEEMENGVFVKLSLDLEDWLKEMGYEFAKETALDLAEIFESAVKICKVRERALSIGMLRWILRTKITALRALLGEAKPHGQ